MRRRKDKMPENTWVHTCGTEIFGVNGKKVTSVQVSTQWSWLRMQEQCKVKIRFEDGSVLRFPLRSATYDH